MSHREIEGEKPAMSYQETKGTWLKIGAGQSLGHEHTQGEQEVWKQLALYQPLPSEVE